MDNDVIPAADGGMKEQFPVVDYLLADRQVEQWIEAHKDEIVSSVQRLIHIPSVKGEAESGAPFGLATRQALENVLGIAQKYGFETKMLDGYAAHTEFGMGAELVGVLSHVDVVPVGSDWTHDPWSGDIDGDKIIGRGAIDDKGPTIAALYAQIAIKQSGIPLSKRIRHILGADEESGFGCMEHYFGAAHEEMPTLGFTPDGRFPVIYAEKGIAAPSLTADLPVQTGAIQLVGLDAGVRSNMVPDRAEARLHGRAADLGAARLELEGAPDVSIVSDGDVLVVRAIGVGAHASTPNEGKNAVMLLTSGLLKARGLKSVHPILATLNSWAGDTSGATLGIAGDDPVTGPLTSNLGVLTLADNTVTAKFSIRHPVDWTESDLRSRLERTCRETGFTVSEWHWQAPLYVPQDSPLISTLLDVYRSETGDMQPAQTMGGGTYARVLKQGVAFGPNFPGFPDNAHQADEYWTITDLIRATRIYAKALIRLAA